MSVEPNGALIVAASTPLVDSTGKFIGVGNNGVGYTIVQGTSGTGSELQDRLTTKYVPAVQLGGEWYGQIGKGSVQTPVLASDQRQLNNSLISTFLIPVVYAGNLGLDQIDLNQVTLTYNPSTLTPGVRPTLLVQPANRLSRRSLRGTGLGLPSLTVTSALRTAQQQAQIMVSELSGPLGLSCSGSICNIPSPGASQNQVWAALRRNSPSTKGAKNPAAVISAAVSTLLSDHPDSLVAQYEGGKITQAELVADTASIIQK